MSKVTDTLDSLLRMYFNEGSTQGEKDNALNLFKKKCEKEGIDSDNYLRRFKNGNNNYESTSQRRRPKSYTDNHDDFNYGFDFEDIFGSNFKDIFGQYRQSRTHKEPINPEDHSKYVRNDNLYFRIKEVIANIEIKNDKVVIFLSTLCKEQGSERWGLRNFVIYPKSEYVPTLRELVQKHFTRGNNKEFIIHTGQKKYFRDHLVVQKIWEKNSDNTETKIFF